MLVGQSFPSALRQESELDRGKESWKKTKQLLLVTRLNEIDIGKGYVQEKEEDVQENSVLSS